jgi:DNA-binding MarR family transcriptional regulator
MKIGSLDFCLKISQAHASLNLKLDQELGTLHGLSLNDFILLYLLSRAEGGRMAVADLVRPMGVQLSAVTRQLVLLEKTGRLQREPEVAGDGRRHVVIRPAGKKLLNEALATAETVCREVLRELPADSLPAINEALSTICGTKALNV